jgi:hypothetical protein
MMRLFPVLKALRFNNRSTSELQAIPRGEWPALLRATDHHGLTLPLGIRCRELLPPLIEARIQHNLTSNAERHSRLVTAHAEIAALLHSRALPFVILKGLTKSQYYASDLRFRPQYDIDIYLPERALTVASHVVETLGYEALPEGHGRKADHLPRMIRKTGWKWREDYYDPEMPTALELHFQFWNEASEGFGVGDLTPFWTRRVVRDVGGMQLPALNRADALSYSTLHLVRHLFQGALQLHHVYEMAHFLDASAFDDAFWREWSCSGLPGCRVIEGIAFRLAMEWFHCTIHPAARNAVDQLPSHVNRWFDLFGMSPALIAGPANKNELFLHLSLISRKEDRRRIAIGRLFPEHNGSVVLDAHVRRDRLNLRQRLRGRAYEFGFKLKRTGYHTLTLLSILRSSLRWWTSLPFTSPVSRSRPARSGLP